VFFLLGFSAGLCCWFARLGKGEVGVGRVCAIIMEMEGLFDHWEEGLDHGL